MADALAKGKKPQTGTVDAPASEDAFVRGAFKLGDWLQQNLRSVVLGIAGLALVVFGAWYYVNFKESVREQAAGELARLRLVASTPDVLISDVEAFVGRFDGTTAADEGRVILARLYLDTGQPAEAVRVLRNVGEPINRPLGFSSRSLLSVAQEAAGDASAAMATLQVLARDARFSFQRRQAQASIARLHADAGRLAEAVTIYSAIAQQAEDEGDLPEAGVYRIRLGELAGGASASPAR